MRLTTLRKRGRLPALLTVLLLVVAACGNGEEEPDAPAEEPDGVEDEDAPEPEEDAEVDNPLAGQSLDFVVPFNPGGGYDTYARLIAPYLEDVLDARITVQNVPGAGGLVAANQTWTGPTDGSLFQIVEGASAVLAELSGEEDVQFSAAEFEWISGVLGEPTVITTSVDDGIETVDDLIAAAEADGALRLTSTGVLNAHSVGGFLVEEALGVPVEVIAGFDGTDAAFGAVLRGEAHGMLASIGTGSGFRDAGEGNIPLSISNEAPFFADDVTPLGDLDIDADAQELLDMHSAVADITRSIIAPPGTDAAAVAALRDAFEQVLTSDEFLAEAQDQGREIQWRSGEEVQQMAQDLLVSPPDAYLQLISDTVERAAG